MEVTFSCTSELSHKGGVSSTLAVISEAQTGSIIGGADAPLFFPSFTPTLTGPARVTSDDTNLI